MDERYSLSQCQKLLAIDFKTLQRWMSKAGIEPTASRADNRIKYLTHAQLLQIGEAHERTLNLDGDQIEQEETTETISQAGYNLLIDRINGLYDIVSRQDKEIAALRRELQAIGKQHPSQQQEAATPGEIAPLRDAVGKLRTEVDMLHQGIDTMGKYYGLLMGEQYRSRKAFKKLGIDIERPEEETPPASVPKKRGKTT